MSALAERIRGSRTAGSTTSSAGVSDGKAALDDRALVAAAEEVAGDLKRLAGHGSPMVAVVMPLSTDAVVMLLAAILGDYSICFLDPSGPQERRDQILTQARPDVVVDSNGSRRSAASLTDLPDGLPAQAEPGYVAMSSGSVGGAPKAVLSPWSSIDRFAPHGAAALTLDGGSTWAEVSHPAYDMAMTNLLMALASGAALRVSAALGDRVRPLRFMERTQATHLRVAPRFIDLAVAERRGSPASLRVWASGGDRLYASHVERVFSLGVPSVVNTYGTSESIGFASSARLERGAEVHALNGTVTIGRGGVGPWRTVVAGSGEQSMLAIKTPHLPAGYLFGSGGEYPRWHAPDTLLTGDAGAEVSGDLFCLGRSGRRVKRNGRFVDLDEVDATLRSHRDVASYTLVTAEGELLSLVEAGTDEARELHRGLPAVLRPDILPDRLVAVRQIPRLGNGKVDQARAGALANGPDVS